MSDAVVESVAKKHRLLSFILFILLGGCQLTLALRSDIAFLNKEAERFPRREPIPISTKIILQNDSVDDNPHIYTSKAGTPFTISLPYSEMLNQAGHVAIDRWFRQVSGSGEDIYFSAKLVDLFYHNHTDVGSNQPLIAVKLRVLVRRGKNLVHEGIYESGPIKGEKFGATFVIGAGERFEEFYSRAVYKAMLIALDKSMQDISTITIKGSP